MLNSLSLRLNNLIARAETNESTGITTNVPVTVDLEILTAIHNRPNPPYKGLVLNEEWLGRLGVVKGKVILQSDVSMITTLSLTNRGSLFTPDIEQVLLDAPPVINPRDSVMLEDIQFVHQLQNIYFILCGKELIIKA